MGFIEAVKASFSQFATFEGRSRRAEFWWFYLFLTLVGVASYFVVIVAMLATIGLSVGSGADEPDPVAFIIFGVIMLIWMLGMLVLYIPYLAVSARRLHDMGQTAHWLWLYLVGLGIVPVIMAFMDSERGPNQWGEDPKAGERVAYPAYYGAPPAAAYPQQAQPGQPGVPAAPPAYPAPQAYPAPPAAAPGAEGRPPVDPDADPFASPGDQQRS